MGNCRFRLSDMIPNAWFYKLKDMSKIKNHNNKTPQQPTKKKNISSAPSSTLSSSSSSSSSLIAPAVPNNDSSSKASSKQPHQSEQRKSYYFTRNLDSPTKAAASDKQEPPRKSSRRRRSTRKSRPLNRSSPRLVSSTISNGCSCRATIESVWTKPEEENTNTNTDSPATDKTSLSSSSSEHDSLAPEYGTDQTLTLTPDQTFDNMFPSPCKCMASGNDNDDVVIDLPPINTKIKPADPTSTVIHQRTSAEYPEKNMCGSLSVKVVKEDYLSPSTTKPTTRSPVRRFPANSGVKLRTNSPKINSNRRRKSVSSSNSSLASSRRTSVSESSFAVVKTSKDPRRDFRESMVEMIVENKIKASKDLEELLACYLSLNSDEYHDLIINVFKQIWFDFVHVRINWEFRREHARTSKSSTVV